MAKKNNERRNQILKGAGIAAGGIGVLGAGAYALRKGKFGKPKTPQTQTSNPNPLTAPPSVPKPPSSAPPPTLPTPPTSPTPPKPPKVSRKKKKAAKKAAAKAQGLKYSNNLIDTINFNMYKPKSRYASDYDNYEFGFNPFRKKSLIKIAPITGKKKLPGASKTPITDNPMARMGNKNKRPNPLAASRGEDLGKFVLGQRRTAGANYSKMNKAPQYSSPGGRGINAGYAKPKKPTNMNLNSRMGRKR